MLGRFVSSGDGILILAVVSTILCFISVFSYASRGASDSSTTAGYDDYVAIAESDPFMTGSALAPLIVSIPPAFDTFLDVVVPRVIRFFFDESDVPVAKPATKLDLFHFTIAEKTLFIIGMMVPATLTFTSVQNYSDPNVVYAAFSNCGTILTVCSILSLLSRISYACTPAKAFFVALLVCLSCVLYSVGQGRVLIASSETGEQLVLKLSSFLMIAAAASFALIYITSGVSHIWSTSKSVAPANRNEVSVVVSMAADDSNSKTSKRKVFEARYRLAIVAGHILVAVIQFAVLCPWYWYALPYSTYTFGVLNYIYLGAAVLVYLLEIRVRKHEAATALVSHER
jgi:hypothetical protein